MASVGIPQEVAQLRDAFQAEAYAHLEAAGGSAEVKVVLRALAEGLLQRIS
jgi:geranylgeranyl diphosphate synthase type II